MEKKDIQTLERIKDLIEEMYFNNLQGKQLFNTVVLIQDFLRVIKESKEPKLKPVGKEKPIEVEKPKKKRKAKK